LGALMPVKKEEDFSIGIIQNFKEYMIFDLKLLPAKTVEL
jgi:hypothetical protein